VGVERVVRRAARAHAAERGIGDLPQRPAVVQRGLQPAQLGVGGGDAVQPLAHEVGILASEAPQVVDQPAGVAELQLAEAAQIAQPSPEPSALAEARRGRLRLLGILAGAEISRLVRGRRTRGAPAAEECGKPAHVVR